MFGYPGLRALWVLHLHRSLTEDQVLQAAGEDAVYYQTKLCGASNAKAKRELHFAPRKREWFSE